jgi:hypothetical protein
MKNVIKGHVVEEESQKKEIHHKQKSSSQTVGKQESNAQTSPSHEEREVSLKLFKKG